MSNFTIDIVSDTVCPWCYIGLRNLQSAITQWQEQHPNDQFRLQWHPFQLNSSTPVDRTVGKQASYEQKLGVEGARNVIHRIRSAGEAAGITFSFGGRTGNTLDSHRLLESVGALSQSERSHDDGLQTRLAEELFADYFEREKDITSHSVLAQAAIRAGVTMNQADVERFLSSNELADSVKQAAESQRANGINGVPHFTINGDFTIEGAQEPIAFLHLFNRLTRKMSSKAAL